MTVSPSDEDRTRFEEMFVRTRISILGYLLRRSSDPADAADLLAETYLVAWRRLDDVPPEGTDLLWLYAIARRVLANHRRHQVVEARMAAALRAQLASSLVSTEGRVEQLVVLTEAVVGCLGLLNPRDREVLELTVFEELTPVEIATITGRSPGAVRVRLHRARAQLQAKLLAEGITSELGARPQRADVSSSS